MGYHPVFVGYECGANGAHIFAAGHLLHAPHSECLVKRHLGVGNQAERKFVFIGEFPMACLAVFAHAYYGVAGAQQFAVAVA